MDAPGPLVVILGLAAMAGLIVAVLASQRWGLERRRREVLERDLAARRGTVVRLAEVARAGWTITARGTVPVGRRE